jgi:asparagine synthase (glutamine-hydrolysing)
MSGITGIYSRDDQPIDIEALRHMTDILSHRGPDGSGIWHSRSVGFGHRLLWTTPESLHEHLPLLSEDGERALTADARIDNRDELIEALGATSNEITDSQLILAAYERWGEHCPEHLVGDYAFALWDGPRNILFCARDHIGAKPFYYYHSTTFFAFASEIKALLCLPDVPRELNDTDIARYLQAQGHDRTSTSYRTILRLPVAHSMMVTPQKIELHQYWSLDPKKEYHFDSNEEYEAAFREVFTEAVRCRVRSAYPVGSELSGGLDSSSVACTARSVLEHAAEAPVLHTFSSVFDEVPGCDERPYINAVLAQGQIEAHYVHPDELSPFIDVDRFLWHADEPMDCANYCIQWALYRAARDAGVRVCLTGLGGDEVVSYGLPYLTELFRKGKWFTVYKELRAFSKHPYKPLNVIVWTYLVMPFIPRIVRQAWRKIRRTAYHITITGIPLSSDLAQRIDRTQEDIARRPKTHHELHYESLSAGDQEAVEMCDHIGAAFSLEMRHPFYDRRVMEFCLALPSNQKLRDGWIRAIVRRALADSLPAEVCWRPGKTDLSPFFDRNLLAFERKRVEDALFRNNPLIESYVALAPLRKAYNEYTQGASVESYRIWKAVLLELWLEREQKAQH